jgi:hypothetical protein
MIYTERTLKLNGYKIYICINSYNTHQSFIIYKSNGMIHMNFQHFIIRYNRIIQNNP